MSAENGGDDVVQAKPIKKRDEISAQKAELDELLERALTKVESGDQKAMDVLLGLFAEFPAVEDALVTTSGDIPTAVESALLRTALPEHLLSQHLWAKRLDRMRAQLAWPDQSPLEAALISRIVTCYLAVNLAELEAAAHKDGGRAVYYDKRLNAAHHRYVSATLALARVRQLLAPVMTQLNIAEPGAQQLNVASTAAPMLRTPEPPSPLPSTTGTSQPVSASATEAATHSATTAG
jgi:hypothetical protein